jgi:glycosyltransferase involved in cell wall biosynthesis
MKIAQVAPLYESVPPKCYGGTERVVSYLTDELVKQGHDVTLYASADSVTRARLESVGVSALRLDPKCVDPLAHHLTLLDRVMQHAQKYDVIHFHTDYLHFPLTRCLPVPHVTTLHGRLDLTDLPPLYRAFSDVPLISICNHQRSPLAFANWVATVYHGLPEDLHALQPGDGGYLAFLGRVSEEKRLDRAIEIAQRVGMPLRIAAKIDKSDYEYFEGRIKPLLGHPGVEFLGEIGEREKSELLGKAHALLFPIDWPEPFGLVMIEALACGTPVIAWRRGSVPEIIRDGETGFVVESIPAAVQAVENVAKLSRERCRRAFEERFSVRRMTHDYLAAYKSVCSTKAVRQSVA